MPVIKRIIYTLITAHILAPEGLNGLTLAASNGGSLRLGALIVLLFWLVFDANRDKFLGKNSDSTENAAFRREVRHHQVAKAVMNMTCSYNPTACLALERFQPVVRNSRCLFAKGACIWGSRDYNESWSLEENVRSSVPMFLQMLLRAEHEAFDGFVFEVRGDEFKNSGADGVQALAEATQRVLCTISDCDPRGEGSARKRYVSDRAWHFVFAGLPIFVTTFAPCYASDHSRHAYGADAQSAFILLQPESSFLRHDLPPDTPHTKWEGGPEATIRDRIRISFKSAGQEYDIPDTLHYPASEHMVKSLEPRGGSVVRWWELSTPESPPTKR